MNDFELLGRMADKLGMKIRYKDRSFLMKVLGFLLAPINPVFMTLYVTTLGKTLYFPSEAYVKKYDTTALSVMAHEYVHVWDEQNEGGLKYKHAYLAPQIYGVLTLAVYSIIFSAWPMVLLVGGYLGCCAAAKAHRIFGVVMLILLGLSVFGLAWLTSGFVGLAAFAVAVAPLAPWPSKGRTRLETRGYAMSVASYKWLYGRPLRDSRKETLMRNFTGPGYYFMAWSPRKVRETLYNADGGGMLDLLEEEPYAQVYEFLTEHGRIRD